MVSAKDIIVKPIKSSIANEFVKKHHYSGKVVQNSCLHFGCFLNDVLGGVMSFGSSLDKSKIVGLVKNTGWNDFLELNCMAFSDLLPRNSESRCISIAMKLIKKNYPNIKWVISFADGCQCGDGTIYRASGFVLTDIRLNKDLMLMPDGRVCHSIVFSDSQTAMADKKRYNKPIGVPRGKWLKEIGAKPIIGYQLRYIYFLDKSKEKDLTVPILPFSKIDEMGAGMYKGEKVNRACVNSESGNQSVNGGASPTHTLHN